MNDLARAGAEPALPDFSIEPAVSKSYPARGRDARVTALDGAGALA